MKIIIIFVYATIIVLSYKPKKIKKEVKNTEFNPVMYKLSKADAG